MRFLDYLYQRYSNPLPLIDKMILTNRLSEFCKEFIKYHNKDVEEKTLWEYFLHKVYENISFAEFVKMAKNTDSECVSKEDIVSIVSDSYQMLASFNPSK